jgi:hypothetical protein
MGRTDSLRMLRRFDLDDGTARASPCELATTEAIALKIHLALLRVKEIGTSALTAMLLPPAN